MGKKVALKVRLKTLAGKLPRWNKPAPGMELTLKEWLMFIIGGMGCMGATGLMGYVTLQQGAYISAACNIHVDHVALIGVLTSVVTIITTPFVSWLIDNTRTRMGKFRPYLLILPIPMILCFFAIGQVVKIQNYTALVIVFAILFNILNFFNRLYSVAFAGIPQVISPSMAERTQLMSIGTFFTSLGPTISGFLYPVLANKLYSTAGSDSNGVNQIGAYEWVLPLMVAIFMVIGVILALGVKERTVVAKNFKQRQSFIQGCKKTVQNKYFWILNISNVFGVMKLTMSSLVLWYVIYDIAPALTAGGHGDVAVVAQSIITMIIGDATVPGMLFAPLVINKIGKKKLILITNFGMAAAAIPMLFIANPWVHLVCIYLMTFCNGFQIVTAPACQAEINDYQQFKTGDRIEGFLNQFGTIFLTAVSIGTAFIAPAVYKSFGYVDNAQVLYDKDILFGITRAMAGVSMASAFLCAIPYFFWDMTEKKHRSIMEVLKIRAKLADGDIDEETARDYEERALNGETGFFTEEAESSVQNTPEPAAAVNGEGQVSCLPDEEDRTVDGDASDNIVQDDNPSEKQE